jgi:hypothetical protein
MSRYGHRAIASGTLAGFTGNDTITGGIAARRGAKVV